MERKGERGDEAKWEGEKEKNEKEKSTCSTKGKIQTHVGIAEVNDEYRRSAIPSASGGDFCSVVTV